MANDWEKTAIIDELNVGGGNLVGIEEVVHAWKEDANDGAIGHFAQGQIRNLVHGDMKGLTLRRVRGEVSVERDGMK